MAIVGLGNILKDGSLWHRKCAQRIDIVSRSQLVVANNQDETSDHYLDYPNNLPGTSTRGLIAFRAGWITALSCVLTVSVETTPGTIDVEAHVNGSSVFSFTITTSGTGEYTNQVTQGIDIDAIAAGDVLNVALVFGTFVGTVNDTVGALEITWAE